MRLFTQILLAAVFTIATFSIVTYTACKQDKCKGIACVNGGACQDGACICPVGFTGTHCETPTNPCASVTCQNGGSCNNGTCSCPAGYGGAYCQIDSCAGVTCQNGGACASGHCVCPAGYEGAYCQSRTRDKFIGTWNGGDVCHNPTDSLGGIVTTIGTGATDVQVMVTNAGGFGVTSVINGSITDSVTITFTNQPVYAGVALNGTMTLNSLSSLTFSYSVSDATGTQTCVGHYTK